MLTTYANQRKHVLNRRTLKCNSRESRDLVTAANAIKALYKK